MILRTRTIAGFELTLPIGMKFLVCRNELTVLRGGKLSDTARGVHVVEEHHSRPRPWRVELPDMELSQWDDLRYGVVGRIW